MTRAPVTRASVTLLSATLVSMTLVSLSAPVAYGLPGNPMDPPMPPSTMGNLFKRDFDTDTTVAQCSAVFRRSKSRVRIDYKTNMPYVRVRISHDGGLTYRTHPTMFPGKTGDAGKTRILGCRAFGSFCSRGKIWGNLRIGLGGCQTDTGQCMPVDEECRVDVSGTAPPQTTKPDITTIGLPYSDPRIAKGCAQTDHDTVRFTAKWEGVPARGYPKVRDTTTGTVFIPKRLKKEADGTVKPMISAGRFSMGENEIDYEVPVPADWTHNRVWEIEFHVGPAANEQETVKVIALDVCLNPPEVHIPREPGDPPDAHIITARSPEEKETIRSVRGLQLKLVSKNDNMGLSNRAPIAKSGPAKGLVSDFDQWFMAPFLNPGDDPRELIWGETATAQGRSWLSALTNVHIKSTTDCVDGGVVFTMDPSSPQSVHLETGKVLTPGPVIRSFACNPVRPSGRTITNNGVSVSVSLSDETSNTWRVMVTPDEAAGRINSEVAWRGNDWVGGEGVVNAARQEERDKCGDIEFCDVSVTPWVTRTRNRCVAQSEGLPDHQPCTSCPPNYKLVDKNCVACPTYQVCNADRTALETAWHCGDGSLPADSRMATVTRCDLDTGTETTTNICLNNGENKPSDSRCPVKPSDPDDVCPPGESLSWDTVIDDWVCKTIACEDDQWSDGSNCEDCDTYTACPPKNYIPIDGSSPPSWYEINARVENRKWCQAGDPPASKKMIPHHICNAGDDFEKRACVNISDPRSEIDERCGPCPDGTRRNRDNSGCEPCPTYKVCPDTGTEPIDSAPFCGKNMPLPPVTWKRYVLDTGFCELQDQCVDNGGRDWSGAWHECCPRGFTMSSDTRSCEKCENTYHYCYNGERKEGKYCGVKPPEPKHYGTYKACINGVLVDKNYCIYTGSPPQSVDRCTACTNPAEPCWNGSACVAKPWYQVCADTSTIGTSLQSKTCAKPKEARTVRRDVCVGSNPMPREYCVGPGGYASVDSVPASQTASDCPPPSTPCTQQKVCENGALVTKNNVARLPNGLCPASDTAPCPPTVCTDPKPCLVNGRCEAKRPFDVDYMVCPGTRYSTDPNSLTVKPRPSGNREAVCSTTPRPVNARKESYEACNSSGTLETRYICVGENGAASVPPSATAPCTPTTPCSDEKWCDTTKPQGSRLSTRTVSRDVNGVCQTASNPPQIETDCDTSCTPKICEVDNNGANTGRVIDGNPQSSPCPADKTRADCPVPPVVTRQVCASAIESTNRANADHRDSRDGARPPGQGAPVTHSFEECVSGVMTTKYICVGENGAASVPPTVSCPPSCTPMICEKNDRGENTGNIVPGPEVTLRVGEDCPTGKTEAECLPISCIDTPDWSKHPGCGTAGLRYKWIEDPDNPGRCKWDDGAMIIKPACEGWMSVTDRSPPHHTIRDKYLPSNGSAGVDFHSLISYGQRIPFFETHVYLWDKAWLDPENKRAGFKCEWEKIERYFDIRNVNNPGACSDEYEINSNDLVVRKRAGNPIGSCRLTFDPSSCEWEVNSIPMCAYQELRQGGASKFVLCD